MVTLTQDAQGHLERYLKQVKAALRGHPSVDAGDIERDVLGHIDAELAGQPEPIGASSLLQVLDRLGTPDTWVPAEDLPAWRRVLSRLRTGPEDWRLAYLAFGLFIAGPVLFIGGPFLWPLEPFLMIASLLFARAALTLVAEHDEAVGARRWLIYPPLVAWYIASALLLFAWPVPMVGAITGLPEIRERLVGLLPAPFWVVALSLASLTLGLWWMVLGLLLSRFIQAIHVLFWPFADWFDRRHATRLALTGLILVVTGGVILAAVLTWG